MRRASWIEVSPSERAKCVLYMQNTDNFRKWLDETPESKR